MQLHVRGLEVRPLGLADEAPLQRLLTQCADYFREAEGRAPAPHAALERIADAAGDPEAALLGLFAPSQLAGLLQLRRPGDGTLAVVLLLLAPEARGAGLGRKVTEALVEAARAEGLRALTLGVQDHEHQAHAFWSAMGFVASEHADGVTDYARVL